MPRCHTGSVNGSIRTFWKPSAFIFATAQARARPSASDASGATGVGMARWAKTGEERAKRAVAARKVVLLMIRCVPTCAAFANRPRDHYMRHRHILKFKHPGAFDQWPFSIAM